MKPKKKERESERAALHLHLCILGVRSLNLGRLGCQGRQAGRQAAGSKLVSSNIDLLQSRQVRGDGWVGRTWTLATGYWFRGRGAVDVRCP